MVRSEALKDLTLDQAVDRLCVKHEPLRSEPVCSIHITGANEHADRLYGSLSTRIDLSVSVEKGGTNSCNYRDTGCKRTNAPRMT